MNNLNRLLINVLLLTICMAPEIVFANEEDESFEVLSEKLEQAIEVRNFHDARQVIEDLMPLMKQSLKEDKKTLSSLKKDLYPEINPDEFEKKLNRKNELYDSLKKLVDVSPAALRVKSELIKKEVQEFIDLS